MDHEVEHLTKFIGRIESVCKWIKGISKYGTKSIKTIVNSRRNRGQKFGDCEPIVAYGRTVLATGWFGTNCIIICFND